MIADEHLAYFITEDIYLLDDPAKSVNENGKSDIEVTDQSPPPIKDKSEATEVHDPATKLSTPEIKAEPKKEVAIAELAIWTPPLTDQDKTLIQNILKAINQNFDQAKIMSGIASYDPNYKKLICFGYQKELELKLGRSTPLYETREINGRTILISAPPELLHSDKNEKMALWSALQVMFPKVS